jgi:hypothetical protein
MGSHAITDLASTVTADPVATTTTLFVARNFTAFGQITTITAQVAPVGSSALQPTGTVTFSVDGTPFRTLPVDPTTGQASFSSVLNPFGVSSLTAAYSGDSNFDPSQDTITLAGSAPLAGTQTSFTARAARNIHGQFAINLVANVVATTPGSGTPTGTVTFFRNGLPMMTKTLKNGTAIMQQAPVRLAFRYIYVYYNGEGNFSPSVSQARTVYIRNLKPAARAQSVVAIRGQAGAELSGRVLGPLAPLAARRHSGPRQLS